MTPSPTATLRQSLPIALFERLWALVQQFPQAIAAPALVLSEVELSVPVDCSIDRFVVVVSAPFSVLLTAVITADTAAVDLQFEPQAIASFLDALPPLPPWPQARSWLQGNDAVLQSEFTRQLLGVLALPQSPPPQHLLDQVIQQMRKNTDLPTILQTAIESVREVLQVDRVVIYQLHATRTKSDATLLPGGMVVYEARATNLLPSVLHLVEMCDVLQQEQQVDRYLEGYVLAVTDVEAQYAHAPCLLKFLQDAAVKAKLVAPIVVRHQLWGLAIAHDCQQPRAWSEDDRRFLQQSAEYLGLAIVQAGAIPQRSPMPAHDLQDALMAAQAASRAKSEFLANVSHELRTPLTTVIGMSATLLRWSFGELSPRQRQYLQTIHDSGERLLHLINDILDLSQLEAGRTVLMPIDFSLTHLAQQSLRSMQEQAIVGGVALKLDLCLDLQWDSFHADPRRVQQILLNLLSNAIKFTPEGGRVTLRLFADDSVAVLQVQDTGIGISEPQQSLLFHKFQQLDATYRRQYKGAGVGLALTKQLVELHGGSISVESTVGVGSVFTVRLPRPHRVELLKSDAEVPSGRIVLIESHEETAEIICDILTAAEYQLVWLLDGTSAIEQIDILQPIAVITAGRAPHIDGYDLLATLRQNPLTKQIKAIVLTTMGENSQPYYAIGADLCLSKPIAPDHLLQQIIRLTATARSA